MSFLELLFGRGPKIDDAEEELGKPDESEAHNLRLHVNRCAKRWKLSYRISKSNSSQLSQQRVLVLAILAIEALKTGAGAADTAGKILAAIFH